MSRSHHRCVFVGNIPYDATEEQLIQICEEVGPVVSFRLVLDRDTGKPKGYGFCEFRDEETALSARRNLQGYEINGRQLRVDFAENEKNVDRNREQGRGGPGFALTLDSQKQGSGVKVSRDPSAYQPVGIAVAAAAAVAMAGTLGGPQFSAVNSVRIGQLNSGKTIGNDPLTIHLASMTRHQLFEIVSQMKGIIQQNPQQARQILVANPQLTKALFQAQIMLGILGPSQVNVPTLSMPRPLVPERQAVLQSQAQASRTQPMQPLSVRSSSMQLQPIKSVQQGKIPQHQIPVTQNQMPQNVLFQPQMQSFHQSHSQMPTSQSSQTLPFLHHMQSLWQSQKGLMQPSLQNVSQLPPLTVSMSPPILSVQITQSQQPSLQKSQLPSMAQSSMSAQHLQVPVSQFHGPSDLTKLKLKAVESTGLPAAWQSELQYRPVEPPLSNQSSQQPFQVSRLTADLGGGPSITQSGFPSSGSMLSGGVSMALGAHQEQLRVPGIGASAAGPPPSVTWTQDPQGGSVSAIAGILHSTASMVMTGNISASIDGNISSSNASNTDIGSIVTPVSVGNFPNATLPVEQDAKTHRESAGIDMTETSGGPITFVASSQGHSPMNLPPSQPQQLAQLPLELEQQKALLQQVMDLTLEQINSLPPEQREQVIQLQQAFRS